MFTAVHFLKYIDKFPFPFSLELFFHLNIVVVINKHWSVILHCIFNYYNF